MEHIAPLVQTVLWVGLIVGIIWRFHTPIHGLLVALQKRVEGGSTLKAGPFELIDQLRPQEPDKQKQKVEAELLEASPIAPDVAPTVPALPGLVESRSRQATYFQAEDLALRAIQAEYGKPISRQLTAGSDVGFDGVFTVNGRLNIVEVKYVRDVKTIPRLRASLERIVRAVEKYNWRNVQLTLVAVFEHEEDVLKADMLLSHAVDGLEVPVSIRAFSLPELKRRFGLTVEEGV